MKPGARSAALTMMLLLLAPLAAAQGGAPTGQGGAASGTAKQFLATLDRNQDGHVSRAEWHGAGATFMAIDRNLDGYLTAEELARRHEPQVKANPAAPELNPNQVAASIRELRDPPELLRARCLACHDEERIERAEKTATGWADTVQRMRGKKAAKISEKEGKAIVEYLNGLRGAAAKAAVVFGSADPRRDWGLLFGGGDLHLFDRDRNNKLDGGELAQLILARADQDGSNTLSPGELALVPLAVDRRAWFERIDRDHNGQVTVKELGAPAPLLDVLDLNEDGALSKEELPRARPYGPVTLLLAGDAKAALEVLDRNRDGRLSFKELDRFPTTAQRFDGDGDGSLDAKELETAVTAARAEGPYLAFDDFLTRYDLDGNGAVERLEFPGNDTAFARLDLDGDGSVATKEAPPGLRKTDFSPEAQRWR